MFKTCVAMLSVRIRMLKCALNTLLVFHLSAVFFENALMCVTSPRVLYNCYNKLFQSTTLPWTS